MTLDEAREVLLLWEKLHPGTRPLTEALRTALAECDSLKHCYALLEEERARVQAECDRLRAARDEYHAQVRELRAENERLERKLAFYTLPDDYEAPH